MTALPSSPTHASATTGVDLLTYKQWKHPHLVKQLLAPDYNESTFISQALSHGSSHSSSGSSSILHQLHQLSNELDTEVSHQFTQHQAELYGTSTSILTVGTQLQTIQQRLTSINQKFQHTRTSITQPLRTLRQNTTQVEHIYGVTSLLKVVTRVLQLTDKIEQQLQNVSSAIKPQSSPAERKEPAPTSDMSIQRDMLRDYAKCGTYLHEITQLMQQHPSVNQIEVVNRCLPTIKQTLHTITTYAQQQLNTAITQMNQADIGAVLQIYYNLGTDELVNVVDTTVDQIRLKILAAVKRVADLSKLNDKQLNAARQVNKSALSNNDAGQLSQLRAGLFERTDLLAETIFTCVLQVFNLERVLLKKRDPLTQKLFASEYLASRSAPAPSKAVSTKATKEQQEMKRNEVDDDEYSSDDDDDETADSTPTLTLFTDFFHQLCTSMQTEFQQSAKQSSYITNVFSSEYPRLSTIFLSLFARLQISCIGSDGQTVLHAAERAKLLSVFVQFNTAYQTLTLQKLTQPIQLMFNSSNSQHSIPTRADVNTYLSMVHETLTAVRGSSGGSNSGANVADSDLQYAVCKTISKSLALYTAQCERHVIAEADAEIFQAGNSLTHIQRTNSEIFTIVNLVLRDLSVSEIHRVYPDLRADGVTTIEKSWLGLQSLQHDLLHILANNVSRQCDEVLYSMHDINFETAGASSSEYVDQLKKHVNVLNKVIIPAYQGLPVTKAHHTPATARQRELLAQQTAQAQAERALVFGPLLSGIAQNVVTTFCRSASLITPLLENSKLRIQADSGQLEAVLTLLAGIRHGDNTLILQLHTFNNLLFSDNDEAFTSIAHKQAIDQVALWNLVLNNTQSSNDNLTLSHLLHNQSAPQFLRSLSGKTVQEIAELYKTAHQNVQPQAAAPNTRLQLLEEQIRTVTAAASKSRLQTLEEQAGKDRSS